MTKNKILYIFFLLLFVSSCVPHRKLLYIRGEENNIRIKEHKAYTVKPMDLLRIRVVKFDDSKNISTEEEKKMMEIYPVNEAGEIDYPLLGKIKVKDKTLSEVQQLLTNRLLEFYAKPLVLVNFERNIVTILGEVRLPGSYEITKGQINIFQAIGLAGDMTSFGNRKKIIVIREKDGVASYNEINLSERNVVKSNYYYLQPNDIVYVEPLKYKSFGFDKFPYSMVLSILTLIITISSIMKR